MPKKKTLGTTSSQCSPCQHVVSGFADSIHVPSTRPVHMKEFRTLVTCQGLGCNWAEYARVVHTSLGCDGARAGMQHDQTKPSGMRRDGFCSGPAPSNYKKRRIDPGAGVQHNTTLYQHYFVPTVRCVNATTHHPLEHKTDVPSRLCADTTLCQHHCRTALLCNNTTLLPVQRRQLQGRTR